jgi:hypothetical protein
MQIAQDPRWRFETILPRMYSFFFFCYLEPIIIHVLLYTFLNVDLDIKICHVIIHDPCRLSWIRSTAFSISNHLDEDEDAVNIYHSVG